MFILAIAKIKLVLYTFLLLPHYLILKYSPNRDVILEDIKKYKSHHRLSRNGLFLFVFLMKEHKHFRNQFYERIKPTHRYVGWYIKKDPSLTITVGSIGPGLMLHHPFSTILNAKYIGKNCTIRHLTTFGNKNNDNSLRPTILDNVDFGAACIIIGDITIGNNCIVGAGSVVTKNVPDNCIVAGNPAKILYKDGVRV